jgi:catechol 2,3-dioxygenase-like lactoylglutathione lyase family enzyme
VYIEHTSLVVEDYDKAIRFFVDALGFDLVEDSPATTNDGRPKRWVIVKPPGAETGLLLAAADGEEQVDAIGSQRRSPLGLADDRSSAGSPRARSRRSRRGWLLTAQRLDAMSTSGP